MYHSGTSSKNKATVKDFVTQYSVWLWNTITTTKFNVVAPPRDVRDVEQGRSDTEKTLTRDKLRTLSPEKVF